MSYFRNLVQGQFQIGDLVFGRGTNLRVDSEGFKINPHDLNAQDYQISRSNEMRFGSDFYKPTTIDLVINILESKLLPGFQNVLPNFWHDMPGIEELTREWRADTVRVSPGSMIPLYYANEDGDTRVIFGRPGQYAATTPTPHDPIRIFTAQFRRADTLSYSVKEVGLELTHNAAPDAIVRGQGDGPSWLKIIGEGPLTNPTITIGENVIKVNRTIPAGQVMEISSYPWQRRAVLSTRENVAADLGGSSPYLDRLIIPPKAIVPVRWTSDEIGTFVPALGNESWSVDIQSLGFFKMPSIFKTVAGTKSIIVRLDIFNPVPFRKFIGASVFDDNCACLTTNKVFNTAAQFSQAQIVEPMQGSSVIVIMSNDTMTNYAGLRVLSSGFGALGNNRLQIGYGTGPRNFTPMTTVNIPGGWSESDKVAIEYNPVSNTYQGYLNGVLVPELNWVDTEHRVSTATTNRQQGYIFDLNGGPLSSGVGFRNLLSYDKAVVPAETGRVYLLWRDAWVSL